MPVFETREAHAGAPTVGYPEAVVQWGVQKGETCEDIAKTLYGSTKHVSLLLRYNRISCKPSVPLPEGMTLVLPEKVTQVPDAKLRSMHPDVRARPAGGGWNPASPGMPLFSNSSVNTLDKGRADIQFVDRTRVFLAENTLVVIYGTASNTKVTKTPPHAVVESGEIKAGLAALRGGSADIEVAGGGKVSAASRDTVVQRKGDRTTVAVFDGKADVSSAGKSVPVPTNFGTRFYTQKPPTPPRPLPPAPEWEEGGSAPISLAKDGTGTLTATWKPVPKAQSYRVELARDAAFDDLVVREEVPAKLLSFRGENMPSGTYYLRVRAIDDEEYLGIASKTRELRLVGVSIEGATGEIDPKAITVSPYGILHLSSSGSLEMAVDQGPFGPVLDRIDVQQVTPRAVRFRSSDGATQEVQVQYTHPSAEIDTSFAPGGATMVAKVRFHDLEGIDIPDRVSPALRVHLPSGVTKVALTRGADDVFAASVALPATTARVRLDVVDGRGAVLGTTEATPPKPDKVLPKEEPLIPAIGVSAPLFQISPATDMLWLSPTAPNMAVVSAGFRPSYGEWGVVGQVRASGSIRALGLDAALRSNTSNDGPADGRAWLGARYRVYRRGLAELEIAPTLRVGIPTAAEGGVSQLEPAIAVGGIKGRLSWLANAGARVPLGSDGGMGFAPAGQGYLLAGGTFDLRPWLRLSALLDTHVVHRQNGEVDFLGGLGAGMEAGQTIFGSLMLRASPLPDRGEGAMSVQLGVGIRQKRP